MGRGAAPTGGSAELRSYPALWPETTEAQARTNLRNLIFSLRRAVPGIDEWASLEGPAPVILDGVGLNITCLSYLDGVDFGIVVDREMIDDAWPLMNAVRSGMADLDAVVCGKRMEPSRPKGRAERQKLPT